MPIPNATHDQIITAMKRYDSELRSTDDWVGWEQNLAHKYAIENDGKIYPVKQIISMATGTPVNNFSGGIEANSYVKKLGFSVKTLRDNYLKETIEKILTSYDTARKSESMSSNTEMWKTFDSCKQFLKTHELIKQYPHIDVQFSIGQGNWAKIPWIAFLDDRETFSTQKGVYCVLLFRQDGTGAYITFAQEVTEPIKQLGGVAGKKELKSKAKNIRSLCNDLINRDYFLDDSIDLHADPGIGRSYSQ
jgi:hypothetical protein